MNVLVLMSDEHAPDVAGFAGHPCARTPNLDELCASGTRFSSAYTSSPLCVPARASFATGRYVHELGAWDNVHAYDGSVPGWGHRLQTAGIACESIGKLHYRNESLPTGFGRQHRPMHIHEGVGSVWMLDRSATARQSERASHLLRPIGAGESKYNVYDRLVADDAVAWLKGRSGGPEPWVLYVGLVAPHYPLTVAQRYLDLYRDVDIGMPRLHPRLGTKRHPWVEAMADYMPIDESLSDDERQLAQRAYLGLVSFMDEQVGRIVQVLEASGQRDRTIVLYTSDHGDNLGVRGLWAKGSLYRESAGIPMVLSGPGVAAGGVCTTPVSMVDLGATILDAAGLQAELGHGQSLLRIAAAPADATRVVFSEFHAVGSPSGGFMVCDGRFKYHHYVGYPPELFDLDADPGEERDLAAAASHRSIVEAYERKLRRVCSPEQVDRQARQAQQQAMAAFGGAQAVRGKGTPGYTPVPDSLLQSAVVTGVGAPHSIQGGTDD